MTGWDEFLFELRRSCFGHFHDADCDVIHRAAFKREIDQRARFDRDLRRAVVLLSRDL